MRLLVIDGNSIANRAFYGIKLLTTCLLYTSPASIFALRRSTICA